MPKVNACCPKCDGPMEEGFLLGRGLNDMAGSQQWMKGPPETSYWAGIKLLGKQTLVVTTLRCTSCGFLESYAF